MYVTNNNQFGLRCMMQLRYPICTLTTDFLVFDSVTCNIYRNLFAYVRVEVNFIVHDLYTVQKLKPCELEDIFPLATNEIMVSTFYFNSQNVVCGQRNRGHQLGDNRISACLSAAIVYHILYMWNFRYVGRA